MKLLKFLLPFLAVPLLAQNYGNNVKVNGVAAGPNITAVTSLNGSTGAITLNPFALGLVPGSVAGTSKWYSVQENGGPTINAVQARTPYYFSQRYDTVSWCWANAWGVGESTLGPQMTLQAAYEPPTSPATVIPLTFKGSQTVTIDPGATLVCSDPLSSDVIPNTWGFVRQLAIKTNLANTGVAIPAGRHFGSPNNWTTTNTNSINPISTYLDEVEEYKSRILAGCTATSGSATIACTDGAFSSTGTGTSGDVASLFSMPSAGLSNVAISSVTNSTTIVLASSATTTVSTAAAATLLPPNKVLLTTAMGRGNNVQAFAPLVMLGHNSTTRPNTICATGDSIMADTGLSSYAQGSWFAQGLNEVSVAALTPTEMLDLIPNENMSQPSETVEGFVAGHNTREALMGVCRYDITSLGINSIRLNGDTAAALYGYYIVNWKQLAARGPQVMQATLMPLVSSYNGEVDIANQTVSSGESVRVAINTWLRDGAPIDTANNTTTVIGGLTYTIPAPLAAGTTSPTACRANYYNGATITTNTCATGTHPLFGTMEIADSVESSRNSGFWKVDPNVTITTGCTSSVSSNPTTITCSTATFTSAINGAAAAFYVDGAGTTASTSTNLGTVTYVSATQVTLTSATTVARTNASLQIDGGICVSTTARASCAGRYNSGDGIHPGDRGHYAAGLLWSQTEGTFTF